MNADEFAEHLRTKRVEYEKREEDLRTQCAEHEKRARQHEREWRWMNRLLLLAFILGVLGIVSRVFWP
jgi:hypothetical protein